MEIHCPECDTQFDIDEHPDSCPECGFGPDNCNHPIEERDSKRVYDVGEGKRVEQTYCGKCGTPVTEM